MNCDLRQHIRTMVRIDRALALLSSSGVLLENGSPTIDAIRVTWSQSLWRRHAMRIITDKGRTPPVRRNADWGDSSASSPGRDERLGGSPYARCWQLLRISELD
jgi:hypothetical protein